MQMQKYQGYQVFEGSDKTFLYFSEIVILLMFPDINYFCEIFSTFHKNFELIEIGLMI